MTFVEELAQILLGGEAQRGWMRISMLLAGLAAVGTISMAGVEILKALFGRALFNWLLFMHFIRNPTTRSAIHKQAVGGGAVAFYTMKAIPMIARIRQISENALIYPTDTKEEMIKSLALAQRFKNDANTEIQVNEDWEVVKGNIDLLDIKTLQIRDNARERIMQLINSNLSGLEIRMTHLWELVLQVLAIIISIILIVLFLGPGAAIQVRGGLGFAIVGGLIAPVAHDILQNIGGRRGLHF